MCNSSKCIVPSTRKFKLKLLLANRLFIDFFHMGFFNIN